MNLGKYLQLIILFTSYWGCVWSWGESLFSGLSSVINTVVDSKLATAVDDSLRWTFCGFGECCSDHDIPANFYGLANDLRQHLYGQHLVQDVVLYALQAHWHKNHKSSKALTLSFHGWPGGGKNYVTSFIVKNLYKKGSASRFVHLFSGRLHFPRTDDAHVFMYQDNLYRWIKGNVSSCPKQIFIFDEVDKMAPQVLDAIKPLIDYRDLIDGVDYRRCIFIFLSNTGSSVINAHFLKLWNEKGVKRDDLTLNDFEKLITEGAFNEKGGFYLSDNIKSNLIDHYIPFLPLERRHVKDCILDEFKKRNVSSPSEKLIAEVMESIDWGPSGHELFSTTGCKRLSQKVGSLVQKYRLGG